MTTSRATIGKHLDLDGSSIIDLLNDGVLNTKWSLNDNRINYIRHLRETARGRGQGGSDQLRLMAERARLAHHQANKTALEEDLLHKRMVLASDVEQDWLGRLAEMRSILLAMPTKLASVALAASSMMEVRTFCEQEINQALRALGDKFDSEPDQTESAGVAPAAAVNDGERMGGNGAVS